MPTVISGRMEIIMNLKHLEYAVAVTQYGSIRKAAQVLLVSQPYLSGIIRGLEQELGYDIFIRSGSGISLTPNGEEFLRISKHILLEIDQIQNLGQDQQLTPLTIACFHAPYIMEQFLKYHMQLTPSLPDVIQEMGNEEVINAVSSSESDLGIIFYSTERTEKYHTLIEQAGLKEQILTGLIPSCVLLSQNHPLSEASSLKLTQLMDYPYVTYNDSSSINYLEVLGLQNHPQLLTVSDRGGCYDALKSGKYLTVSAYLNKPQEDGLTIVPISDRKMCLRCSYVTRKNHRLTKREKDFIAYARQITVR